MAISDGNESATAEISEDKKAGWYLVSAKPTPEFAEQIKASQLALIIGGMAYQLRAALDGLVWDAVTYAQGSEPPSDAANQLGFPIGNFDKCGLHKFPFPDDLKDWIQSVQPSSAEKTIDDPDRGLKATLEDIHNLARFDRHRRLREVRMVPLDLDVPQLCTKPPMGKIVAHESLDCDLFNGKYEFLRLRIECPGGLLPYFVRLQLKPSFEVSVEDVSLNAGENIGVQLTRFILPVERVIARFDAALP